MHYNPQFEIDHFAPLSLVDQMAAGLRDAIEGGECPAGAVLPTRAELASLFGVSEKVSREAVARLVQEGYLCTRRGVGAIATARNRPPWHGNVLFVNRGDGGVYSNSVLEAAFRERMMAEGYLVTTVTAADSRLTMGWLQLEKALRQQFSLVVCGGAKRKPVQMIDRAGLPVLATSETAACAKNCIGKVVCDKDKTLREFARWCVEAGVRTVGQVFFGGNYLDASAALSEAGVKVHGIRISPDWSGYIGPGAVQQAALDSFSRKLASGRRGMPDLLFFTDDYLCAGAVMAMAYGGVRIPEDVRVASIANMGLGPILPFPAPLIAYDWRRYGAAMAEAAMSYLRTGRADCSAARDACMQFIPPAASAP